MKLNVYSVLDTKLGAFGSLVMEYKDEAMIRAFSDRVNQKEDKDNNWWKHPEDFALYKLGEFDQESGELIPVKTLSCLCTASAVKSILSQPELFEYSGNNLKKTPVPD